MEDIKHDEATLSLQIDDTSRVAEARREVGRLAQLMQFDKTDAGRLAIVATELATNLLKHAGIGELLLTAGWVAGVPTIDLLALDHGKGIGNIEASMRDGFSTAGSPGTGLGAIARMAAGFSIYSYPDKGTVVHVRFSAATDPRIRRTPGFDIHGINVPHPHEEVSGDGWAATISNRCCRLLVVDGLGHGPLASEAAHQAIRTFRRTTSNSSTHIIEELHGALRSTRGAVAAVASVDFERCEVEFAGIGNISAAIILDHNIRRLVSHNGTLGSNMRKAKSILYPFPHGSMLVMHSDGIGTHWSPDSYPGLITHSSGVIAGTIYRDHSRHRDDATIVILREAAV